MVDANVLVSELLRVRGRGLIGDPALDLRISEETLDEALHEMAKRAARIVEQGRVSRNTANTMLEDARNLVERRIVPIPHEVYASFEDRASYRVPRDPDDVPPSRSRLLLEGTKAAAESGPATRIFWGVAFRRGQRRR